MLYCNLPFGPLAAGCRVYYRGGVWVRCRLLSSSTLQKAAARHSRVKTHMCAKQRVLCVGVFGDLPGLAGKKIPAASDAVALAWQSALRARPVCSGRFVVL